MTPQDRGWAAGFLDGEGCITVSSSHRSFQLRVTAGQAQREPLERLQNLAGGSISPQKIPSGKPFWQWEVSGLKALALLTEILPELTVKHAEALIALEYPVGYLGHNGRSSLPIDVHDLQESVRERLQEAK